MSPGQESPAWRSRSFTNLPGGKGAPRELEQDPRRGGDALRLPGTLTEHLRPRESAPHPAAELAKGLQHGARPDPEQLGGGLGRGSMQRELRSWEGDSNSTSLGAKGTRDTAQDPTLLQGQAEDRRAQDRQGHLTSHRD